MSRTKEEYARRVSHGQMEGGSYANIYPFSNPPPDPRAHLHSAQVLPGVWSRFPEVQDSQQPLPQQLATAFSPGLLDTPSGETIRALVRARCRLRDYSDGMILMSLWTLG